MKIVSMKRILDKRKKIIKSQRKEFYRFYGIFLSLLIRPATEWKKKTSSKGFYSRKIPARSYNIFYVLIFSYLLCPFSSAARLPLFLRYQKL